MSKKSAPVVRVPGFSRDQLRAVDRVAAHRGWSRAQFMRLAALYVALQCPQANLTALSIKHGLKASPEPAEGNLGVVGDPIP